MKWVKLIIGFAVLFFLYHAAEYMIVYKNSPAGFLGLQVLFFVAAWIVARVQTGKGLSAWGMDISKGLLKHLLIGMLMGIVLYGSTLAISISLGLEKITTIPSFASIATLLALFVFGNFFSSFSEDILTRGYIYQHFHHKISSNVLIFLSASVYLLNHIYRLKDGPQTWIYLFMLGVLFIIPLIKTGRLWFTGGMHWAGNCFFYAMHELVKTEAVPAKISSNYILVGCILLLIPVNNWLLNSLGFHKKIFLPVKKGEPLKEPA